MKALASPVASTRARPGSEADRLSVAIADLGDIDSVGQEWLDLQARSACSFFQSWAWIGTWLRCQPAGAPIHVIRVADAGRTVGLGLVASHRVARHGGLLRSQRWCVSETGDPSRDALTIEHNGFLFDSSMAGEALLGKLFDGLSAPGPSWDELVISGVESTLVPGYLRASAASGLSAVVRWSKPYYYVTADDLAASAGDYLAALSGNARYQIRRAMREYEKRGPLRLTRAQSAEQAEAFFADLIDLHQAYWRQRGQPGAFATPYARQFHSSLIRSGVESGQIDLHRIEAGPDVIGYLYNFVHRGAIVSYQGGFRYSDDPKLKPGLVSHALAVQAGLSSGARSYDFLMGRQQYKEMLSTRQGEMSWLVIQQPRLRLRLERAVGTAVRYWRARLRRIEREPESGSQRQRRTDREDP